MLIRKVRSQRKLSSPKVGELGGYTESQLTKA